MENTTYSYVQQNLKTIINKITDTHEPVLVKVKNGKSVVIIDAEDFESLTETAYLLRSPANARRLMTALEEFNQGKGIELDAKTIMDAHSPK